MGLFKKLTLAAIGFFIFCATLPSSAQNKKNGDNNGLKLWYLHPAKLEGKAPGTAMNETLPIGNGRIGALIFGETAHEHLVLNDNSLWTGDENTEGSYQTLANVYINLPGQDSVTAYRRDLDINEAIAHVHYKYNGVSYSREYFASHPAQVIVIRLTANKPGAYTGSIGLSDAHQAITTGIANKLIAKGALNNGLLYETQVQIINNGGTIKTDNGSIVFKKCNSLTLIIGAGTNYIFDYSRKYHGEAPYARIRQQVRAASAKKYNWLKVAHIRDFQSLFNRVSIDLGGSSAAQAAMPSNLRKTAAARVTDPGMEALLFQYGRYLLISCSRPGALPANLQGLWNDSNNAAWGSDYHDNINIEMNYWPAEPANMAECTQPFFDLIQSQLTPWRKATQAAKEINTINGQPATRGFALRTSHNIYGHTDWNWDKTANAWYCQHLWEHYAFGMDKNYLKKVAYPIMKETVEFWEDHLKTLPDGRLVVPNGWSPEHGPVEDGVSYNQQIVWDLFNNYTEACHALAIDEDYAAKIATMRDKLVGPAIGRWGQFQEWMTDKDDPNDHHRHTSNLFAVYPGRQVTVAKTPALARAAKISLDARGPTGDVREWSFAWRTALYARLHDAEDARAMLMNFFSDRNSCLNLFGLHPPMQMDGNFGCTAAIAEMLLQSHEGEINLLPALPKDWAKGYVKGLRARGGFEVNMQWRHHKLAKAVIHSTAGTNCNIRYGDRVITAEFKPGETRVLNF